MNKRTRTQTLVHADRHFLRQLEERILDVHQVTIVEEPHHALVMMKMRETARNHLFYMGEVLVSECRVRLEKALGLGIVCGDHLEEARMLAVIDACFHSESELKDELEAWIQEEMEAQREKRLQDSSKVLATRVNFETMDEEVKS